MLNFIWLKITQLRGIRRVLAIGLALLFLTLVVVAGLYGLRGPRSGQGKSGVGKLLPNGTWYAFTTKYPTGYDSAGYDFFSRIEYLRTFDYPSKGHPHEWNGEHFAIRFDALTNRLKVSGDRNRDLAFRIDDLLTSLKAAGHHRASAGPATLEQSYLTLDMSVGRLGARLYIEDLTAVENDKKWDVYHLSGVVMVRAR